MLREVDLEVLNSVTKYPSIPTYHALDPKNGNLTEDPVRFDGPVLGTEKIDGTNARIISLPDGNYLLGSREELLYAKGDLIGNPSQGIVKALKAVAERLEPETDKIRVRFLEVYGGKVGQAAKQYSGELNVGFRMFDSIVVEDEMLGKPRQEISAWREANGQSFLDEADLRRRAEMDEIELAPRLFEIDSLPVEIDKMRDFLARELPETLSALDANAGGKPEGIVLRTKDRKTIAKARFQDYDRTLKRRK
ncbi:RNA ligase family protein [Amycolatopsis sp. cg5]|uniref:RNA ligase family protein n=1 Tax=Amycolatopsis sp. cg5 TaxID=3238802 RepID=UPI00352575B1